MAAATPPSLAETSFDVDKLSYEIFSILESKFLFGYDDPSLFLSPGRSLPLAPVGPARAAGSPKSKVCVLSIDGGGHPADGLLAGAALVRLESSLRRISEDPAARVADFFDVAAGSGAGGFLAAMLVLRGPHGRPLFSAEEAMGVLARNLRRSWSGDGSGWGRRWLPKGVFRRRGSGGVAGKVFGEMTLRDTVRPLLVPCYDLATGAPFLFSRADAVESEAYDFRLREVCAATCGGGAEGAVEMRSVDGKTQIAAVGGGAALGNPTAAAITHVLNNKQEFPLATGVDDLLVVSIGCGEGDPGGKAAAPTAAPVPSSLKMVRIAAEGAADVVDQAVAMAFEYGGACNNYIRIQGIRSSSRHDTSKITRSGDTKKAMEEAEGMLSQKNIESVLFRGKKLAEQTNAEKLELFAHELMKERDKRKTSPLPAVIVKQSGASMPSSATATPASTVAITPSTTTTSPSPSYSNLVGQVLTNIL